MANESSRGKACWTALMQRGWPTTTRALTSNRCRSVGHVPQDIEARSAVARYFRGRPVVRTFVAAVVSVIIATSPAVGQGALPDPTRTPGAINPDVRQETIHETICVRGWTRSIRPPQQYTSALKRQQLRELAYEDQRLSDYEEDHLIPLSIGGAPYAVTNLWPQPRVSVGGWNADLKDALETTLNHLVCAGRLPLAEAQAAIARDWTDAFNRFVIGEMTTMLDTD